MMEPTEIQDEEYEQILDRVAAIDVAKATGMVCTRVRDDSRPGRRLAKVWEIPATANAIIELGEYLGGWGSRRSPWSQPRTAGGLSTIFSKRPAWTCSSSGHRT